MSELRWTKAEKIVAKRAFEKCYERECEVVLTKLKERIAAADKPSDIWLIHDFLAEELKKIEDMDLLSKFTTFLLMRSSVVKW